MSSQGLHSLDLSLVDLSHLSPDAWDHLHSLVTTAFLTLKFALAISPKLTGRCDVRLASRESVVGEAPPACASTSSGESEMFPPS